MIPSEIDPRLLWALGALSFVVFIGTLALLPVLIVRMPADYFLEKRGRRSGGNGILRLGLRVLKNVLGAVLCVAGALMLFLPGQGILTMLLGMTLLDLPGKRTLELRLFRLRRVRRAIARLRARAGRPPLRYPEEEEERGEARSSKTGAGRTDLAPEPSRASDRSPTSPTPTEAG